jgi:hypothetical protein
MEDSEALSRNAIKHNIPCEETSKTNKIFTTKYSIVCAIEFRFPKQTTGEGMLTSMVVLRLTTFAVDRKSNEFAMTRQEIIKIKPCNV